MDFIAENVPSGFGAREEKSDLFFVPIIMS
jgi:hypothetical protein